MTDTTRDLIQRLVKELDLCRQMMLDDCTSTHPFADEARAYLAQPEPEYPSDKELLIRAARRPKPPSLKEQGLQALEALQQRTTDPNIVEPLRRALEALPDD